MSELSQSDQLCLFQYLVEGNEIPDAAGSLLAQDGLGTDSAPSQTSLSGPSDEHPIEEALQKQLNRTIEDASSLDALRDSSGSDTDADYVTTPKAPSSLPRKDIEQVSALVEESEASVASIESALEAQRQLQSLTPPLLSQSLSDEQERIFHLEQALDQALHYLDELNARVKHQAMLKEQVTLTEEYAYVQYQAIARLQEDLGEQKEIIAQRNLTIASLESDRALAQTNLLSLQQDQLNLRQENAQWKNACQELQQECDRQHRKMLALEQENTVMQEQILQQARQSNEHETAVQYWKDKYTALQQKIQEFQKFLEEKVSSLNHSNGDSDFSTLLCRVQRLNKDNDEQADGNTLSAPSLHSFSIPEFLIRRYRHRGSGSPKSKSTSPQSKSADI